MANRKGLVNFNKIYLHSKIKASKTKQKQKFINSHQFPSQILPLIHKTIYIPKISWIKYWSNFCMPLNHKITTCWRLLLVCLGLSGKGLVGKSHEVSPIISFKLYIAVPWVQGFYKIRDKLPFHLFLE